jgi:hypothetical protein
VKITIESTTKIVELNRVPARIWEGKTESGISVIAYVTRIACPKDADQSQFQRELQEQAPPSAEAAAIPLRLIL